MNMIAIVDAKWGIARKGKQIITIPEDTQRFRNLTMDGVVIMGRKTYEVIGHALPDRRNIVLSRDRSFSPPDAEVYNDIDYLMLVLQDTTLDTEQWLIGGEAICRELLPFCDQAFITYVYQNLGADKFITNLDNDKNWDVVKWTSGGFHNGIQYDFTEYRRLL